MIPGGSGGVVLNEAERVSTILAAAREAGARLAGGVLALGPGDDAAVLRVPPGDEAVWTTDDQLEGVHFRRAWCGFKDLGRKAVGASLSDLAAMGARPLAALVSVGLPPDVDAAAVADLGHGLGAKLAAHDCALAGGNVSASPLLTVCVSALGSLPPGSALRRDAGQPGDVLYVSGPLGNARLALLHLEAGGAPEGPYAQAVQRLLDPTPRFDLAEALRASGRLACMDLSDGLAVDLPRLAQASGCAAHIESLPGPDPQLASDLGLDPSDLAWIGGEDYELLIAGPPALEALGLIPIGQLTDGEPGLILR